MLGVLASKAGSLGLGAKLGLVALTLSAGFALTLAGAEASGDPYGDGSSSSGEIDGPLANVTGAADGTIVQIGANDLGGSLTVEFSDNVAYDGAGADVRIHTLDTEAPAEALIELSANGVDFVSAGNFFDDVGPIDINLGSLGLSFATAVRISYVSGEQPGFDLDAVEGLNQIGLSGATINLDPAADTDPGFAEHVVTAFVADDAVAAPGIEVTFEVTSGPSATTDGSDDADGAGEAQFGWTAPAPGLDVLTAWLDIDGSGTPDAGEPFAQATKLWSGDTGSIELIDVDGDDLDVGDLVQILVDDLDLDTTDLADTISVNVFSTSDATGINVLLTEIGVHSGVFAGTIVLGAASDDATDVLEAAIGDDVTGVYDDALDATGANPAAVSDTLTVFDPDAEEEDEQAEAKVTVCHRPPGNPGNQHTLEIGASALDAHLAHGDEEGECGETDVLTKQEQAEERKAERDEAFCERKGDDHPRCRED